MISYGGEDTSGKAPASAGAPALPPTTRSRTPTAPPRAAMRRNATHPLPPTRAMSDDLVRRRGTSGRMRTVRSPRACGSTLTPAPASAVTRTRRRLPASPSAVARTQPLPIARRGRSRRTRERHDRGGRGSRRSCSARLRLRTTSRPCRHAPSGACAVAAGSPPASWILIAPPRRYHPRARTGRGARLSSQRSRWYERCASS
jgi:hypothetical protein